MAIVFLMGELEASQGCIAGRMGGHNMGGTHQGELCAGLKGHTVAYMCVKNWLLTSTKRQTFQSG